MPIHGCLDILHILEHVFARRARTQPSDKNFHHLSIEALEL